MKYIFFAPLIISSIISISCKETGKKSNELRNSDKNVPKVELKDMIGKTYEFNYVEKYVYHMKFESDSMVNWKLIKGDFPGPREETDKYIYTPINDHVFLISWVEKSGLEYSNILDFSTGELITHATQDGVVYINPGKFKMIK